MADAGSNPVAGSIISGDFIMYAKTTFCNDCGCVVGFKSEDVFIDKNDVGEDVYAVSCDTKECYGVILLNVVKTKFGISPKP